MFETISTILGIILSLIALGTATRKYLVLPARKRRELRAVMDTRIADMWSMMRPEGGPSMAEQLGIVCAAVTTFDSRIGHLERHGDILASHAGIGFMHADANGMVEFISRAVLEQTGRTPDELRGRGWFRSICAEDRKRIVSEWLRAIHDRREFDERFAWDHDGKLVAVHMTARPPPVQNPAAVPFYIVCTVECDPVPAVWPDTEHEGEHDDEAHARTASRHP